MGEEKHFTRTYNSTGSMNLGYFGYGWSFSGDSKLAKGKKGITVHLEDGSKYFFKLNSEWKYENELTNKYNLILENNQLNL